MSSRRIRLCGTLLVVLLVMSSPATIRLADGQAAPPTAGDIEIGTPSTDIPMLITPTLENGGLKDGHHGDELTPQQVVFNPATHEVGLAKNPRPGARLYGNQRVDAAYYKSDLSLFDYVTTNGETIGNILLTCAGKKLIIAPNYVVYPVTDDAPKIDPSSYCASVQFAKGDECNKPGTTLTLRRNSDAPAALADAHVSKINRKTDVMTWSIERGGAVIKTGSFGFPVVATEPDLVKYVINLP